VTTSLRKRDRIRQHLIALIEARGVGQTIPGERPLAADLGVSRPTLRSVVDELINEGWLVREHGRGVFVSAPKATVGGASPTGPAIYPPATGSWSSRVLGHAVVPAGQGIGSRLRVDATTPILRISRLRLVDGEPMFVETIHVLHELVPDLDPVDLETDSLYTLLRDRFQIVPTEADQVNEASAADTLQASLLDIAEAAPILTLERVTHDQHGRAFEFTRAAYRSDRYRIESRLALTESVGASLRLVPRR